MNKNLRYLLLLMAGMLTLVLTGWVGLATVLAAISLVPAFVWLEASEFGIWFSVILALFVVFMHRSNIRNLVNGTEHRFEKIRIANWFKRD